jgi:small subunit ribosomal protein S2
MVEMGLHFGHQARKWNPKMAPYIYTKRNGVHIIDLIQTCVHIKQAVGFLTESAAQGKTFLFVGTKKQAAGLIAKAASESNSFYVNQRWLGGMLTNWSTMKLSIAKLKELETRERDGGLDRLPKKEAALCKKQKERLEKYLGGVKDMIRLPDVVVIVGQPEEMNAVRECRKLGIRSITVLDTNCDPTVADLLVPANDDSVTSLRFLLQLFSDAIAKGQNLPR